MFNDIYPFIFDHNFKKKGTNKEGKRGISMEKEIERKFRIKEVPSHLELVSCKTIDQNYLAYLEEEVRVRKITSDDGTSVYRLTIKWGKGLEREELETEISENTYLELIEPLKTIPIRKKRYEYTDGDTTYTIDIFVNLGGSLILVELEFSSVEDAGNFNPPSWLNREVTGVDFYYNKEIWQAINNLKIGRIL